MSHSAKFDVAYIGLPLTSVGGIQLEPSVPWIFLCLYPPPVISVRQNLPLGQEVFHLLACFLADQSAVPVCKGAIHVLADRFTAKFLEAAHYQLSLVLVQCHERLLPLQEWGLWAHVFKVAERTHRC